MLFRLQLLNEKMRELPVEWFDSSAESPDNAKILIMKRGE
jgi:hypothetical protein